MNQYDDVQLDVAELLRKQHSQPSRYRPEARSAQELGLLRRMESTLARYSTAALYRAGLWRRLLYANLKLAWFYEFREYWVKELGLRRIELPDFYFLSGVYRQKFQALEADEAQGNDAFLATWQDPAALYLLFAYQYKLALHPLSAYTIAKYISPGDRICEYGCGLAPITQSLLNYYPSRNVNITATDIPSYMLHFLHWKFRDTPYINITVLDPGDDSPLKETYDVITCMTVFEHLPRPLPIAKHLHQQLKPGGIFMFDYIKSEGEGLDTQQALADRSKVLEFIKERQVAFEENMLLDLGQILSIPFVLVGIGFIIYGLRTTSNKQISTQNE